MEISFSTSVGRVENRATYSISSLCLISITSPPGIIWNNINGKMHEIRCVSSRPSSIMPVAVCFYIRHTLLVYSFEGHLHLTPIWFRPKVQSSLKVERQHQQYYLNDNRGSGNASRSISRTTTIGLLPCQKVTKSKSEQVSPRVGKEGRGRDEALHDTELGPAGLFYVGTQALQVI